MQERRADEHGGSTAQPAQQCTAPRRTSLLLLLLQHARTELLASLPATCSVCPVACCCNSCCYCRVLSLSPARTRARWPADDGAVSGTALLTCVCTTVWWRSPEHRVGLVGEGWEYAHQHARTHACTSPTPTNTHTLSARAWQPKQFS